MVACGLVGVALFLMKGPPVMSTAQLSISLNGFTNGPTGSLLAAFDVRNSSSREIDLVSHEAQVSKQGIWSAPTSRSWPSSVSLRALQRELLMLGPPSGLRAQQQDRFYVLVPQEGGTWRVAVSWAYRPTRAERVRWFLRHCFRPPALRAVMAMLVHTNYSSEMSSRQTAKPAEGAHQMDGPRASCQALHSEAESGGSETHFEELFQGRSAARTAVGRRLVGDGALASRPLRLWGGKLPG